MNKHLPILIVLFFFLMSVSCNNKTKSSNTGVDEQVSLHTTDTIYKTKIVRDTIFVTDTIHKNALIVDNHKVMYIGVENKISLQLTGVSESDIDFSLTGGSLRVIGNNQYAATFSRPGTASFKIRGQGLSHTEEYKIKRIPDPIAKLSRSTGGSMNTAEFKSQGGVSAFLENFDYDVACGITGFQLTYIARKQDPIESINSGARYNNTSLRLVRNAKPGDIYIFTNIKAQCPSDPAGRSINSMVFFIK